MSEWLKHEEQDRGRLEEARSPGEDFVTPHIHSSFPDQNTIPKPKLSLVEKGTSVFASTASNRNNEHESGSWADAYFKVRAWEPVLYKVLGVTLFKKYVPTGGTKWNRRAGRKKEDLHTSDGLNTLINRTYALEVAHLLCIIPVFAIAAFFNWLLVVTIGMQLLVNVYPIMLQRYNRALAQKRLREIEGA